MNQLQRMIADLGEALSPSDEKGLKKFVAVFIVQRAAGNVKGAKQTKANIDKRMKKLGLSKKEKDSIFMAFGDPDDPKTKADVLQKAKAAA